MCPACRPAMSARAFYRTNQAEGDVRTCVLRSPDRKGNLTRFRIGGKRSANAGLAFEPKHRDVGTWVVPRDRSGDGAAVREGEAQVFLAPKSAASGDSDARFQDSAACSEARTSGYGNDKRRHGADDFSEVV